MAEVHEKRRAVLLRRDRIVLGELNDLEGLDAELHAAGRARLAAHCAGDAHRRLLRDLLHRLPRLVGDFFLEDDALEIAAAVANDRKLQLPRSALVVEPAVDHDLLADVPRELLDADRWCHRAADYKRSPLVVRRFAPAVGRNWNQSTANGQRSTANGVQRGTRTRSDCGTIVTTSGVDMVATSPSMPRRTCGFEDCTFRRVVRKERKPGAFLTRPAR